MNAVYGYHGGEGLMDEEVSRPVGVGVKWQPRLPIVGIFVLLIIPVKQQTPRQQINLLKGGCDLFNFLLDSFDGT